MTLSSFLTSVIIFTLSPAAFSASLHTAELQKELTALTRGFDGRVGLCVQAANGSACVNSDQRFSMQSVIKMLVAMAVMDRVDQKQWKLTDKVVVRKSDLSVYVQPISKLITEKGYETTVDDLMRRAVVDSDSAATDILIAKLGGPAQVQAFLTKRSIKGVRIDRDERHLQTEILGMEWRPEYVDETVFRAAINKLPESRRDDYYRRYQKDVRDTATPSGMAALLYALAQGKLLQPQSTQHLLDVMAQTVTFPDRLKAGLSGGWTIAHKTGTGGSWKGVTAATNDVGILTAPDGTRLSIVAFIGDTREAPEKRAALMASAAKLAIRFYR
jgi:beta-lactamase class A